MSAEPVPRSSPDEEGASEESGSMEELVRLLDVVRDIGTASPELQAAAARLMAVLSSDSGRRLRLVGRARKVSVSMPEDLTAAVQRRVGRGEFSQYVTEAVARQLELDLLGELTVLLEAEHGPVSDDLLAEARRSWPDVR
jgi:Arc/MetJ-type ribon-helix-helix transcriptional regulator